MWRPAHTDVGALVQTLDPPSPTPVVATDDRTWPTVTCWGAGRSVCELEIAFDTNVEPPQLPYAEREETHCASR